MLERNRRSDSVARLKARVRAELEKLALKRACMTNADSPSSSVHALTQESSARRERFASNGLGEPAFTAPSDLPPLRLQPGLRHERKAEYRATELLQYHDRDFVRKAFLAILNREPDASELTRHLDDLRSGRCNKSEIIERLLRTPEGRTQRVRVKGLRSPITRWLTDVPLVGYLLRTLKGLIRLPVIMKNQQQFEAYVLGQQQLVIDHVNQLRQNLLEHQRDMSALLLEASDIVGVICESFAEQLKQELSEQLKREFIEQLKSEIEQNLATELRELIADNLLHQRQELEELIVQEQAVIVKSQKLALNELAERLEHITNHQQQLKSELSLQERRLARLLRESVETARDDFRLTKRQAPPLNLLDGLFAAFEERFRGERAEIKERLRTYRSVIAEARERTGEALILDLGCGRGEWLEIAAEAGWHARGVDTNRILVERCRALGLDAVESEALTYLRTVPDNSLSAVTAFHLIEHLPFIEIVALFDEALRVLKTGGRLIVESPNPKNLIVGACNFYSDPTHRRPLFPETVAFVLTERGFTRVRIAYQNPANASPFAGEDEASQALHHWFFGPRDFAVIADKP